jgi:hypothetical protein
MAKIEVEVEVEVEVRVKNGMPRFHENISYIHAKVSPIKRLLQIPPLFHNDASFRLDSSESTMFLLP